MKLNYSLLGNDITQVAQINFNNEKDIFQSLSNCKSEIYELLYIYGAIVFKGIPVENAEEFERFVSTVSIHPYGEYREAATPRSQVHNAIFTSTDYPQEHPIYLHNENSHVTSWPNTLFFYCHTPPQKDGATPIADCRNIFQNIDSDIRSKFQKTGISYKRTYGYGLGIEWQKSFGLSSKKELSEYLIKNKMNGEWIDDKHLEITYNRWASAQHPTTKENIWFNHGLFFNVNNLEENQRLFARDFGVDKMPYHTYYGDGEEIPADVIQHLQERYDSARLIMPWNKNDILMIDNMLMAHGRQPYTGNRKVLVAMTGSIKHSEIPVFPSLAC